MEQEIDPKAFGRRVKERRKELDLSQDELAEASGYSQSNIGWVEQGKAKDPKKQAIRLAEALQLHLNWLLYEIGPRETEPPLPSAEEFSDIYAGLPLEAKKAMVELAAKYQKRKKTA